MLGRPTVRGHRGRAGGGCHDLELTQPDRSDTDAERLHRRFLRCKARREPGRGVPPGNEERLLTGGENPVGEAWSPLEETAETRDVDGVESDPDHVGVVVIRP